MKDLKAEFKADHIHTWKQGYTSGEQHCTQLYNGKPCVALKLTQKEWDTRQEAWSEYYRKVTETPAYITYQALRQELRNPKETEKLLTEMDNHYKQHGYLTKPQFLEPSTSICFVEGSI